MNYCVANRCGGPANRLFRENVEVPTEIENLKIASGKFYLGIIINDKAEGMILAHLCIHIYVNIT